MRRTKNKNIESRQYKYEKNRKNAHKVFYKF